MESALHDTYAVVVFVSDRKKRIILSRISLIPKWENKPPELKRSVTWLLGVAKFLVHVINVLHVFSQYLTRFSIVFYCTVLYRTLYMKSNYSRILIVSHL